MNIAHHLDDATLMSCAAGALPPALAAVAASHISLCRRCSEGLARAERIGAALLANLAPVALTAEPVMPREDAPVRSSRTGAPAEGGGDVPAPLARLIGPRLDAIAWRPLGLGVWHHAVRLEGADGGELRLIKVGPGRSLPAHGHGGMELTLVLRGAYQDELGRFAPGDIADLDEATDHRPVADAQTGCICVLACEGPARFHGLLARLMQPLTGL
jgi:putative transcriptional regulator